MRLFHTTRTALKVSFTAMALSAFAVAPLATLMTPHAAFAKGGNGGGNGGGHGGGGGSSKSSAAKSGGGASKAATAKSKSSGGGNTKAAGKSSKSAKAKTAGATKTAATPTKEKGPLHASNLGKLNGAIHSSPNAKLAHIRNGNFNGPVGMAAALALADYSYAADQEAYAAAAQTLELAAAFDLIENAPTPEEIAAAQELVDNGIDDGQADLDAQALLDYPDLTDALALTDGITTPPTDEEIAAAQAMIDEGEPSRDDVTAAEAKLLAAYKGTLDDASSALVLDAVRASLPTAEEIAAALPPTETSDSADNTDTTDATGTEPNTATDTEEPIIVAEETPPVSE